jgi:hypothetical protein
MSKHTPGPWLAIADDDEDESGWVVASENALFDTIARPTAQPTDGEELANARLIAAAPELFDGCNALLGLLQLVSGRDDLTPELREVLRTNHRVAEAEAAVAKATLSSHDSTGAKP